MYKCTNCNYEFPDNECMIVHYSEYYGGSSQESYACPNCGAGSEVWDDIGDKE